MVDDNATKTKSKQHAKWILLGILVFALFVIVAVQVKPSASKASLQINEVDSHTAETFSPIEKKSPGFQNEPPRIGAIAISSSGGSTAYVGEKFAREGDIVNGFRILKIYPNKVEFEKNGKTIVGFISHAPKSVKSKSNNSMQQPVNSGQVR